VYRKKKEHIVETTGKNMNEKKKKKRIGASQNNEKDLRTGVTC